MGPARRKNVSLESATLLVAVMLTLGSSAQAERLPIKTYTTADGLARDHINRIVADSRGFLWFCTSEGLSRFDGYKFTNYGIEQGLPGRQVYDFLEGSNGDYWVATNEGLCRFILDPSPQANQGGNRRRPAGNPRGADDVDQRHRRFCLHGQLPLSRRGA